MRRPKYLLHEESSRTFSSSSGRASREPSFAGRQGRNGSLSSGGCSSDTDHQDRRKQVCTGSCDADSGLKSVRQAADDGAGEEGTDHMRQPCDGIPTCCASCRQATEEVLLLPCRGFRATSCHSGRCQACPVARPRGGFGLAPNRGPHPNLLCCVRPLASL
jgi:hypothetical protein